MKTLIEQFTITTTSVLCLFITMDTNANTLWNKGLDKKEQSLVRISSFTAQGKMEELTKVLNEGLDAGLTINEINEALVQLYAYCGFPRSLNGIGVFMGIVNERKQKGMNDKQGKEIVMNDGVDDKYEQGRKVLEELTQMPQSKPAPGFGEFSPRIDAFLKEHLFADIFASDVLTYRQRELVTITALSSMPGTESQLRAHIFMGMNVGVTENQLDDLFSIIEKTVGKDEADIGRNILQNILEAKNSNQ
jgi:alkylhydroperoxidase/carboxymuconolactone decarboxylase family protein YurZ